MGDHSFPPGTVFGPDGQPGVAKAPASPPDVGFPASQERGYQEVEALEPDPSQGDAAGAHSLRAMLAATAAPMATRTKVLNVARSQIGFAEGPNNDNKYGIWYGWNHVAYCAIGVTWTFFHAANNGGQINGVRGQRWSYCPWFVQDWKSRGRWHDWTETPHSGDVVFFNWSGTHGVADHVGIVESVDHVNGQPVLVTLEFNTTSGLAGSQSDGGGMYRRRRSTLYVVGYGRPDYAPEGTPIPIHTHKLMPLIVDGVWGKLTTQHLQVWLKVTPDGVIGRATRRRLQEALGITADGVWGPVTHKQLQRRLGVPADGVWGPQTVKALQKFLNRTV